MNNPTLIVPQNLMNFKQWLVWRFETRDGGKPTKRPFDPKTGRPASVTDPSTWAGYEEAVAALQTGDYCGIGFVLTGSDPFCAVDLDNCRNPESGAIEPWALDVIRRLNSYAEISPSDHGVHVLVRVKNKARLPTGRKAGNVEIYTTARYLTITGNHLENTPIEILERQSEIETLIADLFGGAERPGQTTEEAGDLPDPPTEAEVQALVRVAEQLVPDCKNLLFGNWPEQRQDGLDRSGLEFMLARRLVECGLRDLRTIAVIVFGSSIHRAKAHGRSAEASWKLALDCAAHALEGGTSETGKAGNTETTVSAADKLLSEALIWDEWVGEVAEPEALWDGILYRGAVHLLAAPAKRGKSRFIHDLLGHISNGLITLRDKTGREFQFLDGRYWSREYKPGQRVLVITEESRQIWKQRGIPLGRVDFLPTAKVRATGVEALAEIVRRNLYDLVILDTFDKVFTIEDENDNAAIINALEPLLEATHNSQTAVLLVHHFRKSGGSGGDEVRGGTALLGAVDVYIAFRGVQGSSNARELEVIGRFDEATTLRGILEYPWEGSYEPIVEAESMSPRKKGQKSTLSVRLLEYLDTANGPLTMKELAEKLGISEASAKVALGRLVKAGKVRRAAKGLYVIDGDKK